jgi:hypothetical protein
MTNKKKPRDLIRQNQKTKVKDIILKAARKKRLTSKEWQLD